MLDIEEKLSEKVKKAIRAKAQQCAVEHHFSNAGEPDFPADVVKKLFSMKGWQPVSDLEGAVVWEPFENCSAADLYNQIKCMEDSVYDYMLQAVAAYIEDAE